MPEPLSVALVWHMHQPDYRDGSRFLLPWVRHRASKDYGRMVERAARVPGLRITMNWVPTLLEQLAMYTSDAVEDTHRELSLRPVSELSPAERAFFVHFTRSADHPHRTDLLDPLVELLAGIAADDQVDDQALLDLQVWSMLAWLDPEDVARDAALSAIARLGRGFDEEVKRIVDERQMTRVRAVLPLLSQAVAAGGLEITTSPYAHPILPLLIDQESARVARPDTALPPAELRFRRPQDAALQVRRGLELCAQLAGAAPAGMWPSECAVSPAAAAVMANSGVRWAISDEGVLARSLGQAVRGDSEAAARLYHPYRERSGLQLVFRDAVLSNRIGFDYPNLPAGEAVADLTARLEDIAALQPEGERWLVVIALDGENCWDYYENDGNAFLDGLYAQLTTNPRLRSVHVGEFLSEEAGSVRPLETLWSGSWIDSDFSTWIGEPAQTRAWALLAEARSALDAAPAGEQRDAALRQALIAEGSDWFWWFSSRHHSGIDAAWDALFRAHLRRLYEALGQAVPPGLDESVLEASETVALLEPLRGGAPRDGQDPAWAAAGIVPVPDVFGAMQPAAAGVRRIRYLRSQNTLHLRIGDTPPDYTRLEVYSGPGTPLRVAEAAWTVEVTLREDPAGWWLSLEEQGRGAQRIPVAGSAPAPRRDGTPVVIVAAECTPLAVAGDLAETVRCTAEAVAAQRPCIVIIPRHRSTEVRGLGARIDSLNVDQLQARVLQGSLGAAAVLVIDIPELFDRPGIYGEPDDALRYSVFSRTALQVVDACALPPCVVHGFEWESGVALALASGAGLPTVLSLNGTGYGQRASLETLRAAGVNGLSGEAGAEEVDLLELARASATRVVSSGLDPLELQTLYQGLAGAGTP